MDPINLIFKLFGPFLIFYYHYQIHQVSESLSTSTLIIHAVYVTVLVYITVLVNMTVLVSHCDSSWACTTLFQCPAFSFSWLVNLRFKILNIPFWVSHWTSTLKDYYCLSRSLPCVNYISSGACNNKRLSLEKI